MIRRLGGGGSRRCVTQARQAARRVRTLRAMNGDTRQTTEALEHWLAALADRDLPVLN